MLKTLLCWLSERFARPARRTPAQLLIAGLLAAGTAQVCLGSAFVLAPNPWGTIGGSNETGTIYPFLINQIDTSLNAPKPTMRYQQVYNSSLFTNVDPQIIYVTSLRFYGYIPSPPSSGWQVPSMQINLSTTTNTADHLSTVFAENVGADDTVVFGPGSYTFTDDDRYGVVPFNRPLRFHPPLGNLLVDVRIFDGTWPPYPLWPPDPFNPDPRMDAYNSPTDEISRVWATNVTATTASGSDTTGLTTGIGLSPVPSLKSAFLPWYCSGCPTNTIRIWWPPQPTNFVLQSRDSLGPGTPWQAATNQVWGSPNPYRGGWWIELQRDEAGPERFFRLVWPGGQ